MTLSTAATAPTVMRSPKARPLDRVMAELMGREDGLCHGLGGSMHLVDVEHGFLGATGVVGGNLPLALGSALAARRQGGDRVTVAFFGDGAVQAGHFSESINLAALWALPVIFVCENNGVAEFTSRAEHTTLVERQRCRGAVRVPARHRRRQRCARRLGGVRAVSSRARQGRGPMLLECLTHRRRGHYEGDAEPYRDPVAERNGSSATPWRAWSSGRSRRAGSTIETAREHRGRRSGRRSRPRCGLPERAPIRTRASAHELVYARRAP